MTWINGADYSKWLKKPTIGWCKFCKQYKPTRNGLGYDDGLYMCLDCEVNESNT